jgi:hypothetical protein
MQRRNKGKVLKNDPHRIESSIQIFHEGLKSEYGNIKERIWSDDFAALHLEYLVPTRQELRLSP